MKIGVFDSGLGGLFILRALSRALPLYDYVYLGDTLRVPYGNRSQKAILTFLEEAVDYLFKKDCALIIVACNTASAEALRKIQQEYLPLHYPDDPTRRVLGVIIPTAEAALKDPAVRRIGILATESTVRSKAYEREIKKINPRIKIFQQAAPLLVPLIESEAGRLIEPILHTYLQPLLRNKVQKIILGCTHYPVLKKSIKKMMKIPIISQDEIIPSKLKNYLKRHPEIDRRLSKRGKRELFVTDITPAYERLSHEWFGEKAKLSKVAIVK